MRTVPFVRVAVALTPSSYFPGGFSGVRIYDMILRIGYRAGLDGAAVQNLTVEPANPSF
jgi:hypothetical protein